MAQLIKVDGTKKDIIPKNKKHFKLKEMYSILSCRLVEFVRTKNEDLMILDEEGKLRNNWRNNINNKATELYKYGEDDPIVGDVLICKDKDKEVR